MVDKLVDEFGVSKERAVQIPDRVRKVVANPEFKALEEDDLVSEQFMHSFINNLLELLKEQEEETIEARWNKLVKDRGLYAIIGDDILLYDPSTSRFAEDRELIADDGRSLTTQEAMYAAWKNGIEISEVPDGIQLGDTVYRRQEGPTLDQFNSNQLSDFDQPLDQSRLDVDAELHALADVEFPEKAPRNEFVKAIAAARRYITDTGGATMDEIVQTLEPEHNYPIGANGVHARAKGFVPDFRTWWCEQVKKGLEALPDIKAPLSEGGQWRPEDAYEGGFESEDLVTDILEEWYLFEVSFHEAEQERELVAFHDEITRPSAKPLHGPPVFRFQSLTTGKRYKIKRPDLTALEPLTLEQLFNSSQDDEIESLDALADEHSNRVRMDDVDATLDALRTQSIDPTAGLAFLSTLLQEGHEGKETIITELSTLLGDRPELLTNEDVSLAATTCLADISETAPEQALDTVPLLETVANSGSEETRDMAIYALSNISAEYPEELLPMLDILLDSIAAGNTTLRTNALSAVGHITKSYPDTATTVVASLVECLDSAEPKVRANAAGLLGDIAQFHPDIVVDYASVIAGCLTADDDQTRINASIALLRAGEANPETIRAESEHLAAALDDSRAAVRANACTLIGNTEAPVSMTRLKRIAEDDPDEEVREKAEWAATRIE
ncbi:HEAT repeat domain-containing protein [Halorientalis brevis]|uniref:HEAT repeat domain-containing protein n=1 Tax=Halorientalis brevis TaxID=1126241 RepID=A0ABD6CFJ8_9EURY|nr:HEAT repeat domain-containing protein [Halorientalis brevis]